MRKKLLLLLSISVAFVFQIQAQATWAFAKPTDGSGTIGPENSRAICTDASGNTYVVGNFNGSGVPTDFDLDAGPTSLATANSVDGYIASYDKFGVFRWKTIISGTASDFGNPSGGVCTDGTNVWIAGSAGMTGAPTIASASNTITISSVGAGVDAFVAKLNCNSGFVQWAQAFGGTGNNDFAMGICLDPNGFCYVSGAYSSAFMLGFISAPPISGTISDFYIAKFNPSGTMIHFNSGGSTVQDAINAGTGLCYVPGITPAIVATGHTGAATAAFGTFTGLPNSGGFDAFLVELDTALASYNNALVFGSSGSDELLSAVYDPSSGGVYVAGFCSGNITFPGTAALTGLGAQDIVIACYSVASNNFVWAQIAGGTGNDRGWGMASDNLGGIFLSGSYASPTCSFGGTVTIGSNAGLNDLYVTRYNASGTPIWAVFGGGTGSDDVRSIASYVQAVPYQQIIFATGLYTGAAATIASTILTNDGGSDFYLARIHDPIISCQSPTLTLSGQTNVSCNGGSTGSATVTASGGAPYTYTWSPSGGNAATATGLSAGNYSCVTTNSCGLTALRTVTITQPASALTTATAITNVACNGGSTGAATVTANGGTGPYTYLWSTAATTSVITGLNVGVRTVTVTDANGCTSTKSVTISQPATALSTATAITNVLCNGGSTGAATVTASGGTGPYTYLWSTAATTSVITGLNAGIRTVTVTDANGCTSTKSVTITQPASALTTATAVTNVLCNGNSTGSATITPSGGTGPYTYLWSGAQTTSVITAQTSGVKTVTVTDANGCTSINSANITQPASALNTATSITNVLCNGGSTGSATVTASGGTGAYTYLWSGAQTTSVISALNAGVRTVTVTDANGCTSTKTVTITQPVSALGTATAVTNILCFGGSTGSATVTASGGTPGYTYLWSGAQTTSVISGQTSGIKTVTVTDANGCTSTATANITQPGSGVTSATAVTNVLCNGNNTGSATITASGGSPGYSYLWSGAQTTSVITNQTAGVKTVTVTDVNGCITTNTVNISQSSALVVSPTQTNVTCVIQGAASVSVSGGVGGYTYTWTPSGGNAALATGLNVGNYTCNITDANACVISQNFAITANTLAPTVIISGTNQICNGQNVLLTASGATSYSWNTGATSNTIQPSPITNTTYIVTGTNSANGCTNTAVQTITVNALPIITVNSGSVCSGSSFTISPSGANTFTIQGGSVVVAPGSTTSYTVIGTSTAGCVSANSATSTVTVFATPTISISNSAICPGNSFTLNPSGANTYTYLNGGPIVSPSITTSYSVTGTSTAGCVGSNTAVAVITVTNTLNVTITGSNTICNGQSVLLTANGATSYSWNVGPTTTTIAPTPTINTTYSVTGVSGSCTNTAVYSVTVNALPSVSITGTSVICIGSSVNLTASGANTYSWDTGPTTNTIATTPTTNITYTVIGTALNGCSNTAVQSITVNPSPTISITNGNMCPGDSFTLTPTGALTYTYYNVGPVVSPTITTSYSIVGTSSAGCISSNTAIAVVTVTNNITVSISGTTVICNGQVANLTAGGATSYTWNTNANTTTIAPSPSVNTTYSVIGTSGSCSNTAMFIVTVNPNPTVTAVSSETNVLCVGQTATLTASGANTFSWSSGGVLSTEVVSPTVTTNYTVTGTDANGCINSSTITQSVSLCTGISATQSIDASLNVYPNPSNGLFTIKGVELNTTITIYNTIGELVKSTQSISNNTTIDLSDYSNGIYFVKIKNSNGEIIQKLIKQ